MYNKYAFLNFSLNYRQNIFSDIANLITRLNVSNFDATNLIKTINSLFHDISSLSPWITLSCAESCIKTRLVVYKIQVKGHLKRLYSILCKDWSISFSNKYLVIFHSILFSFKAGASQNLETCPHMIATIGLIPTTA